MIQITYCIENAGGSEIIPHGVAAGLVPFAGDAPSSREIGRRRRIVLKLLG